MTTLYTTAELWMPGHPARTALTLVVDAAHLLPNEPAAIKAAAAERWLREQTSDARPLAAGDEDFAAIAQTHGVTPERLADLLSVTTATVAAAEESAMKQSGLYPPLRLVRTR